VVCDGCARWREPGDRSSVRPAAPLPEIIRSTVLSWRSLEAPVGPPWLREKGPNSSHAHIERRARYEVHSAIVLAGKRGERNFPLEGRLAIMVACRSSEAVKLVITREKQSMNVFKWSTLLAIPFMLLAKSAYSANTGCNPPSPHRIQRSQAFLQNTSCAALATACNQAGYVLNCHPAPPVGDSKGLVDDCMRPVIQGQTVAGLSIQMTNLNVMACQQYCKSNSCKEENNFTDR